MFREETEPSLISVVSPLFLMLVCTCLKEGEESLYSLGRPNHWILNSSLFLLHLTCQKHIPDCGLYNLRNIYLLGGNPPPPNMWRFFVLCVCKVQLGMSVLIFPLTWHTLILRRQQQQQPEWAQQLGTAGEDRARASARVPQARAPRQKRMMNLMEKWYFTVVFDGISLSAGSVEGEKEKKKPLPSQMHTIIWHSSYLGKKFPLGPWTCLDMLIRLKSSFVRSK